MTQASLLFLYGLCAWGAVLNFPAWAALLRRRWQAPDRSPLPDDAILLVRLGLTLLSVGIVGLAGTRLAADLMGGTVLTVPHPIGLLSIGSMALAEPIFLRVDEIHARSRGRFSWSWRIYWAGAAIWAAAVILAG